MQIKYGRKSYWLKVIKTFLANQKTTRNPLANQKCNRKSIKVAKGKGGVSSQTDGSYETARTINAMSRVAP